MTDRDFIEFSNHIRFLNINGNYEQIKIAVEDFLDENPFGDGRKCHYFRSYLEEILFDSLIPHGDNVIVIERDYVTILKLYSDALIELGQYSKAKSILRMAYDLNPFSVDVLHSLLRVYDLEMNYKGIKSALDDALKIVYDKDDLFRIYRMFGKYLNKMGEKEMGNLLVSLISEDSFKKFDVAELKGLFNANGIQLGFGDELMSAYQFYVNVLNKKGDFAEEYNAYQDYWELCEFNEMFE